MDPAKTRDSMDAARNLFFENPSLAIHEAARELAETHHGLPKETLSRIRMEVRNKVSAGGFDPKSPILAISPETARRIQPLVRRHGQPAVLQQPVRPAPVAVAPAEPFNPPRIVQAAAPVVAIQTEPEADPNSREARMKWLEDWVLNNVDVASAGKARQAMIEHFGPGLGMGLAICNDLVKAARDAAGLPRREGWTKKTHDETIQQARKELPPNAAKIVAASRAKKAQLEAAPINNGTPTMEQAAKAISQMMRAAGIQRVELDGANIKVLRSQPQEFAFRAS